MRNMAALSIIIILVVVGFWLFYLQKTTASPSPTPAPPVTSSPTPSFTNQTTFTSSPSASVSYCTPSELQANLDLNPGAGNIYGTFTIKNTTNKSCAVLGGGFIALTYSSSVKNIEVTHQGQTQPNPFELSPNQTLYSQVHYPNGPQCPGPTLPVSAVFTYRVSPTDSVTFKTTGHTESIIQACQSPNALTQVEIWELSTKPITPQ